MPCGSAGNPGHFQTAVSTAESSRGSGFRPWSIFLVVTIHFFCSTIRSNPRWIIEAMATRMTSFSPPRR